MAKSKYSCERRGHVAHDGWKPTIMRNDLDQGFTHNICRHCHCVFVVFTGTIHTSPILDARGSEQLAASDE